MTIDFQGQAGNENMYVRMFYIHKCYVSVNDDLDVSPTNSYVEILTLGCQCCEVGALGGDWSMRVQSL